MIKVENLTKKFDDFKALDKVSCMIPEGCIYGIVGSNGAGKSTLLRILSGVYKADEGTVLLNDQPVYENPQVKKTIAYVPDELYFLGGANMDRMAKLYRASYPDFDMERYEMLAEKFQLDRKKSLNTFSKGMKRQVATILAISCRPQYLFFDETFDGLDPIMRTLVKKLICQDVEERGITAIMTSHSLRELEDTCDQLALLHKGGLVFESDISDLKTSLFKVQVAFKNEFTQGNFENLEILQFTKHGSVANMIVRGDKNEVMEQIETMKPVLLEILPLSLEEVFTYEMEALGYVFEDVLVDE